MIRMVDMRARIPPVIMINRMPSEVKSVSKLISCSLMISIHLGMIPTERPASPVAGLIRPVTSCWLIPATMNRPTPDPTPHLDTTSSI